MTGSSQMYMEQDYHDGHDEHDAQDKQDGFRSLQTIYIKKSNSYKQLINKHQYCTQSK